MKSKLWHESFLLAAVLVAFGMNALGEQTAKDPLNELIQYIHAARERGVAEARIRREAVTVGWPAATVDEAMAKMQSGGKVAASASAPLPPVAEKAPAAVGGEKAAPPVAAPAGLEDYQIGPGDALQVSVWKEPEASVPSVVVRPDGMITVPLIKDVAVAGLTPRQAEAAITEKLAKFLKDPNVTVVVAAINSKKIFVIGGARKEGYLPYSAGMTVMQALSEAGGLTDYARRRKIYVLRTENGREYRLDFDYAEFIKGERTDQNILLLPGDAVIIPH